MTPTMDWAYALSWVTLWRGTNQKKNTSLITLAVWVYIHRHKQDKRTGGYHFKPNTDLGEPLHFDFPPIKPELNRGQMWIMNDSQHYFRNETCDLCPVP